MADHTQTDYRRAQELLERGNQFAEEGHSIQAMDEWKEAVRLNPNLMEAHLNLGAAYADQGDLDRAVAELDAAYRIDPENEDVQSEYVEVLNERGVQFSSRGDSARAIADWRMALEVDPDSTDANYNLGNALADAHDVEGAQEHLHATIRENPTDIESRYRLAQVLVESGREDAALSELDEALVVGGRLGQALSSRPLDAKLGQLSFDADQYEAAAPLIENLDDRLARVARLAAELRLKKGDYEAASGSLEQAPFDREAAPLWLAVAKAQLDAGETEDGILALRRAYQCDPDASEPRQRMDELGVPYVEPPTPEEEEELEEEEEEEEEDEAG